MAEAEARAEEPAPKKASKLPLLIGLVLMLGLGGGGFYATYSGMLFGPRAAAAGGEAAPAGESQGGGQGAAVSAANVDFVPIPPLLISLDPSARASHLRFSAQLEVDPKEAGAVTKLMPRVLDVLNSYLRAVQASDLENPSALTRLRAQMLRRIQLVLGEGKVRDLLVTEFVLN